MSDESVVSNQEEPVTNSQATTIHGEVQRILSESTQDVRNRVVNCLVEEKLEERKKMVIDGLSKLKLARQELSTLERKGTQLLNRQKQPVGEMTFTKEQLTELDKAQQKVNKLEAAINKAISEGDYTKLTEMCK